MTTACFSIIVAERFALNIYVSRIGPPVQSLIVVIARNESHYGQRKHPCTQIFQFFHHNVIVFNKQFE